MPRPRKGDQVELAIQSLSLRCEGEGVLASGESGGGPYVVRVRGAVPGDRVSARIGGRRRREWSARLVEILEPSPDRIEPRCVHFGLCGGCSLQSLNAVDQARHKSELVARQLTRWEHPTDVIRSPLSLEDPWFYRNKMEMTFGYDADGALALGLHPPGYRYEVFSMQECFLQSEESTVLTRAVADWARSWELQPFVSKDRGGFLRTLMIREGKRTGDRLVELVTEPLEGHQDATSLPESIAAFSEAVRSAGVPVTTVYWTRIHAVAGSRTWMEEQLLYGPATFREELHVPGQTPLRFEIHPRAFFQPNTRGAELLYEQVVHACGPLEDKLVLDLYCGTGTIALYLAQHARTVMGIELEPDAVENARANARSNQIENVSFYAGDVGKVLSEKRPRADVVVVDPPRSGLDVTARQHVVATGAPRLVYVSCNPEALGRDLVALNHSGYRLLSIQPMDLFPQTAHVENVAVFVREDATAS